MLGFSVCELKEQRHHADSCAYKFAGFSAWAVEKTQLCQQLLCFAVSLSTL